MCADSTILILVGYYSMAVLFVVLFPKISVGIISKILLNDNDYRASQKGIEKVQENSAQFFLHLPLFYYL